MMLPEILPAKSLSRETAEISIPDLNNPALIILKNEGISIDEQNWLGSLLSKEETAKCLRFRFTRDRVSYTIVHGFLRWILGKKLGISPDAVSIRYNFYGKPFVSGYDVNPYFNMSHSFGISTLAFDPLNEIGVDVELIEDGFDFRPIVENFFSPGERKYIFETAVESRNRFYEIWTRKEAWLKAVGAGITENLHVDVLNEEMSGLVSLVDGSLSRDIIFRSMQFEEDYRITLAMDPRSGNIESYVIGENETNFQNWKHD